MKSSCTLFPIVTSPYLTLGLCLTLSVAGMNYWKVSNQNIGLRERVVKHKETLDMLEEARDKLMKVEDSHIELKQCKEELKTKSVERYELLGKLDEMKKLIQEKDERALELGKRLNDVRKQFNKAKDEAVESVFKTNDKELNEAVDEVNVNNNKNI